MILVTVMVKVRNQIQNGPYRGVQEFLVITKLADTQTEVEEKGAIGCGTSLTEQGLSHLGQMKE